MAPGSILSARSVRCATPPPAGRGRAHGAAPQVVRRAGVPNPCPSAVCATGEPATYPCGRSWRSRRRGVPCRSSVTVSRAPSPIERTRRQSVWPRQASRGEAGLKPAAISSRHSSSTGACPCALMPSASQRSEPMSVARTGACERCWWRLICETTSCPGPSISEAQRAASALGFFVVFTAPSLNLALRTAAVAAQPYDLRATP